MSKALEAFKYAIVNDDWEATVEVDRNDIEDDTLGIYAPMAQEAGFSAKQLPDEIDADLKNNAFVNLCYDGQYFYDTDHPVADSSVSNKGTAALSQCQPGAGGCQLWGCSDRNHEIQGRRRPPAQSDCRHSGSPPRRWKPSDACC